MFFLNWQNPIYVSGPSWNIPSSEMAFPSLGGVRSNVNPGCSMLHRDLNDLISAVIWCASPSLCLPVFSYQTPSSPGRPRSAWPWDPRLNLRSTLSLGLYIPKILNYLLAEHTKNSFTPIEDTDILLRCFLVLCLSSQQR